MNTLKKYGGRCLCPPKEYVNCKTPIWWECREGHKWPARADNIKQGQWCYECSGRTHHSLEEANRIAKERGGKCLSKKYKNTRDNLLWECGKGHQWPASFDNVYYKTSWCPDCSEGKSEKYCRELFENIFNKKFDKARPKWLISPKNRILELDGFSKELSLAFEYQGVQHYKYQEYFHKKKETFYYLQKCDQIKKELCRENNIILIEVPHTILLEEMREHIIKECQKYEMKIPYVQKGRS